MRSYSHLCVFFAAALVPAISFAYGEGDDIPYNARAIHLLTNEARTDPAVALETCGNNCAEGLACYEGARQPLYWRTDLAHAAQFHAKMTSDLSCMQHPSPCELVSTIADDYPDKCDGSVACACVGGTASCHSISFRLGFHSLMVSSLLCL